MLHLKPSSLAPPQETPPSHEADVGAAAEQQYAHFDISTEVDEFEKDLNFLKYVQSDDVYNVEQFINVSIGITRCVYYFRTYVKSV